MRPHPSLVLSLVTATVVVLVVGLVQWQKADGPENDAPRAHLPEHAAHVDHATFFDDGSERRFASGPDVTRACLECHADAGQQVLHSTHWTWAGDVVESDGTEVAIGKKNLLNNFCISIEGNWPRCTGCHAGYGWDGPDFDFSDVENVDCLVCHEQSGQYVKETGKAGHPAADVDLLEVARSVGRPTRANCGRCHFNGGGGNAVKHGDLDGTMLFPTPTIDVHMGRHDLQCVDCHRTTDHVIPGRSMSVSVSNTQRVTCNDCHSATPHVDERVNAHTSAVACQTCHIPRMAPRAATKMHWDWSAAGEDRPDADPHDYSKLKGSFVYERDVEPEYAWYDGRSERYLKGDVIDPDTVTALTRPLGDIDDSDARIWPFKVHRGRQPYDTENSWFVTPQTYGGEGYWTHFDWDRAIRNGTRASGLDYSGSFGFAPTAMYWPLSHMVKSADEALQCADCHGEGGRMNWEALGYPGDPATRGGRDRTALNSSSDAETGR